MSAVLTAIRGGPESEATLERAASLARTHDLPLHLLYVVNLDFLSQVTGGHIPTADEELTELGRFILDMAATRLADTGLPVETHIRHGRVYQQVIELANELGAEFVVVGHRRPDADHPTTRHSVVRDFADRIRAETGAEVVVAEVASGA